MYFDTNSLHNKLTLKKSKWLIYWYHDRINVYEIFAIRGQVCIWMRPKMRAFNRKTKSKQSHIIYEKWVDVYLPVCCIRNRHRRNLFLISLNWSINSKQNIIVAMPEWFNFALLLHCIHTHRHTQGYTVRNIIERHFLHDS